MCPEQDERFLFLKRSSFLWGAVASSARQSAVKSSWVGSVKRSRDEAEDFNDEPRIHTPEPNELEFK